MTATKKTSSKTKSLAPAKSKTAKEQTAKQRQRYIIYGLGAGAVLGGGYLLFNYLQDRKLMNQGNGLTVNNIVPTLPSIRAGIPTPSIPAIPRIGFPLKRGSRGNLVKQLQQGLLKRGGSAASHIRSTSIRPDGTPDGVFGSGTEKALRAAGYSTTVSEATFDQITKGSSSTSSSSPKATSSKQIADELIEGANSSNLFGVLNALKKLNNTADYLSVKSHVANRRVKGVRVSSPVTALLSVAFKSNEAAKVKIRAEFRRMGLKQNSRGVWTLAGFGELGQYMAESQVLSVAITERPTLLKNGNGDYILPALEENTVVGYMTNQAQGVAQILTENGVTVYAPSQNLKLI
ncbi:MAG: hypothetical protein Tsb0034_20420 [Ekhidna sp.]